MGLNLPMLAQTTPSYWKDNIKEATTNKMRNKEVSSGQNKYKFLTDNKEHTVERRLPKMYNVYLEKLPKEQAMIIFMARTMVINSKANYKNMHPNTICRGGGGWPERKLNST